MAIEVTGTTNQVQWLICTTSDIDLGVSIPKGIDAHLFLGWLDKDARRYPAKELRLKLDEFCFNKTEIK